MTQLYQAGIGPSQTKVHIRRLGDDPKMSLCESTVIARDYRAEIVVNHPVMCKRCWRKMMQSDFAPGTNPESVPPSFLGVSSVRANP